MQNYFYLKLNLLVEGWFLNSFFKIDNSLFLLLIDLIKSLILVSISLILFWIIPISLLSSPTRISLAEWVVPSDEQSLANSFRRYTSFSFSFNLVF